MKEIKNWIKRKISSILQYFAGYISIERPLKEEPSIKMECIDLVGLRIRRIGNKRRSGKRLNKIEYKKFTAKEIIDWKNYL